jgi:hypothetical protein
MRVIFALVIALTAYSPLLAQDTGIPDTVYFGEEGKAYGSPSDLFSIPIYIVTDQELNGISIGIEYGLDGYVEPVWDSISEIGSIFDQTDYFDLIHGAIGEAAIDGVPPDTLCISGAALFYNIPPGKFKYCDVWFSGGTVGEQVMTDSAWASLSCVFALNSPGGDQYTPQFIGGLLTIEPGPITMNTSNPDTISIDAGELVSFEIGAFSYYTPVTVQLDSIVRIPDGASPMDDPQTFGSNPLTFEWTPTPYEGDTEWLAYFTATDAILNSAEATVQISVLASGSYYGLIGDSNCDGMIDIDDVVFLINYIFASGPAPTCD